jgi:hypothetical protein
VLTTDGILLASAHVVEGAEAPKRRSPMAPMSSPMWLVAIRNHEFA